MFVTFLRDPLLCFAQRNVYELFLMLYKHMIFQTMLVIQTVSTMFDSRGTIRLTVVIVFSPLSRIKLVGI